MKAYDWRAVDKALADKPDLITSRDERGRNLLHVLCGTPLAGRSPRASIKTADTLLARGVALADHAFTRGDWESTPIWWCIAHGRNLALAEHLLKLGASPDFSMFAACWNDDAAAIDLLVRYGARVEESGQTADTPFLAAVGWGRFAAADALVKHGANVNATNRKGQTAFHIMLKKGSDFRHFASLAGHGARADIPDPDGVTAAAIMLRKKDERFPKLARTLAARNQSPKEDRGFP